MVCFAQRNGDCFFVIFRCQGNSGLRTRLNVYMFVKTCALFWAYNHLVFRQNLLDVEIESIEYAECEGASLLRAFFP